MPRTERKDAREAASTLRRVLAEVDAGRLTEGGAHGAALRRRLEGVIVALEAVAEPRATGRTSDL